VQAFSSVDVLLNGIADWHQSRRHGAHPIGQGGDIELDAFAGKKLALPVQREMRTVFSCQYLSEQLRASRSA
jgi:hypothetical protein